MKPKENTPLIVANWKMNCLLSEGKEIIRNINGFAGDLANLSEIVICPPFTLLHALAGEIKSSPLRLGGQDCSNKEKGAFTGDISAAMLKDAACGYVILGHSERRHFHNEQNELVRSKAEAAHNAGLTAIICIGETLEEKNHDRTLEAIGEQILASLPKTSDEKNTIIAYEPVWAIGSGKVPTTKEIAQAHEFIAKVSNEKILGIGKDIKIIYGGSVKGDNAAEILKIPSVSGLLIGGASLNPKEFWSIVSHANVGIAS